MKLSISSAAKAPIYQQIKEQIQAAILMEQGDGGGQISRFHIRFSFLVTLKSYG